MTATLLSTVAGGIGQWLVTDLVGLLQGHGVAYSHPVIAPAIVNHTDLPHAGGRFQTMRGEIAVSWRYNSGNLVVNTTLPPGVEAATVVLPCAASEVREGGHILWTAQGNVLATVEGVLGVGLRSVRGGAAEQDRVAVSCGSGTYSFTAQCVA